ncbi:condensation domain-containing protein [Mycobacterium sp. 155]|uniref:condensation domain-containing protein n=1 Tax=Mycobacterium sp. 155 TaxID=1157943 RepID=UPI00035D203C|nr:condensation domain-containing protein [Mycobacterium sp. 155]
MVALGNISGWQPSDGPVTTWMASHGARAAAHAAKRSTLPPTYQRAQHLRKAYIGKTSGKQLPRLMVVGWDIPGVCDIPAMTAAINAHVRRHDAYHDWFEFDNGAFVRRTIADPRVIDFAPVEFGYMTAEEVRNHALAATPETLQWDCFTFGIVQHTGYFTFYASIDHLHIDGISAGVIFFDIHLMYHHLITTGIEDAQSALAPVSSYRDFARRQHDLLAGLTMSSPEARDWIEFARDANGAWPSFPLPLGDKPGDNVGRFVTVDLLDDVATESFDTACCAAGARFVGGVLACAALAERELAGTETYHGFTPYDTRTPSVDAMTVGWFASLFPVTVPTSDGSFPAAARAAQRSFDGAKHLADVPLDRVLELAAAAGSEIEPPVRPSMMVSYIDFRKIPVSSLFDETNFGTYGDNLNNGEINMWINRHTTKTTVTVSYPDNAVARKSVHRYIAMLCQVFAHVAQTTADWIEQLAHHANSSERCAVCTASS